MDVPVLRRDLSRIKVGSSSWDREHKESIRAALAPSRGANTIRENPVRDCSGDVFREMFSIPCSRSLSCRQTSITTRDEPYLPLLRAYTQKLRPTWCLPVCIPFIVG
eukprot:1160428-Pelagomonas_calceolata.AAC.11